MTEDTKDLIRDVLQTLEHVANASDMFHSFEVNRAIGILEALVKES